MNTGSIGREGVCARRGREENPSGAGEKWWKKEELFTVVPASLEGLAGRVEGALVVHAEREDRTNSPRVFPTHLPYFSTPRPQPEAELRWPSPHPKHAPRGALRGAPILCDSGARETRETPQGARKTAHLDPTPGGAEGAP